MKLNLRRVVNKKNMKKTAKTIFIAGVWYYVGRWEDNRARAASHTRVTNRSRKQVRQSKRRVSDARTSGYWSRQRRNIK